MRAFRSCFASASAMDTELRSSKGTASTKELQDQSREVISKEPEKPCCKQSTSVEAHAYIGAHYQTPAALATTFCNRIGRRLPLLRIAGGQATALEMQPIFGESGRMLNWDCDVFWVCGRLRIFASGLRIFASGLRVKVSEGFWPNPPKTAQNKKHPLVSAGAT